MSKEKQIEEMAKITAEAIEKKLCTKCEDCKWGALRKKVDVDCTDLVCAEALYNAGYRKQSEGEWVRHRDNCIEYKCSVCEYEHCRKSNYCPNCGAKMKGGAE